MKINKELDKIYCLSCGMYHGWDGNRVDCPKERFK